MNVNEYATGVWPAEVKVTEQELVLTGDPLTLLGLLGKAIHRIEQDTGMSHEDVGELLDQAVKSRQIYTKSKNKEAEK